MTDAVIYAWREDQGDVWTGEWALNRADKWVPAEANKYILATPEALAPSPEVQALIAEAVAAERERCVEIAVRHWEGEPEDTIAMAAEMRAGMNPLTDYERKVAQMREDFPNGI